MPQLAIIAGESSGDASGAALATALKCQRPDLDIWGAGGPRMKAAGVDLVADLSSFGAIGIIESLKVVPRLLWKYHRLKREILTRHPDVLIPIDFGAFNLRLISAINKDAGIKVAYYFPPGSWRRELKDPTRLCQSADVVITPFPWSAELLTQAGIDARFVGHPLLDMVRSEQAASKSRNISAIGILPGSRRHEICSILPEALKACSLIASACGEIEVHVGAAPGTINLVRNIVQKANGQSAIKIAAINEGRAYYVMSRSDLLIACSGTATLEAAIMGTPMIIVYNGPWLMKFEYLFRRSILKGGYAGMPNIIAQREVCPELLGESATGEKIAKTAIDLLKNSSKLDEIKSGLAKVRKVLGEPGATARAAKIVLETGGLI